MMLVRMLLSLSIVCVAFAGRQAIKNKWMDPSLKPSERASLLISAMQLSEKLQMLSGQDNSKGGDVVYVGYVPGIPRLEIPELRLNDGPQGYRDDLNPFTTTAWPSALAVSATWDVSLFHKWGNAMGKEFFGKGANVQLGPGVNLARVPTNGRNFEYISGEDSFLGYTLVKPLVKGIQSQNVIANAKHWVENNQETNRATVSEVVDERTRFELYYQPFYGAVEAGVGSFMCSYNKVNGFWSCENPETLQGDLKTTLGFKGFVMSDWWATHSTSINAGLDMEMPTSYFFTNDNLEALLTNNTVTIAKIDDSLTRIFTPMFEMGLFDVPNNNLPTNDVTSPEHTELARELSAQSHVLLKNDGGLLPLSTNKPLKIALIGRHARAPIIGGGGSGSVMPKHAVSPYAGVLAALGIQDAYPVQADCTSTPLRLNATIGQGCWPSIPSDTVEQCAQFCAADNSCRYFTYNSAWPWCTLFATNWGEKSDSTTATQVVGTCLKPEPTPKWQCNEEQVCVATIDGSDVSAAASLAKEADVAIVAIASYSLEGVDRINLSFDTPLDGTCQLSAPAQDSLVSAIAATGTKTVVAAVAPGAMLTPWRDEVHAILHGFMPGQEYGHALADVLFGKVNPAARLSVTLPTKENEVGFTPAQFPGIDLQGVYSEKMLIGYRWYSTFNVRPAYAFGHGLSYTTFSYSGLAVNITAETVTIKVKVTNIGARSGSEVAQLYVTFPPEANTPPLQLKGFMRTATLSPTETVEVEFQVGSRQLSVWDEAVHNWKRVFGEFKFAVGASSVDIRLKDSFHVKA